MYIVRFVVASDYDGDGTMMVIDDDDDECVLRK